MSTKELFGSKKHREKISASCYVDIHSQEYDKYTPLYKRLSLSKSGFLHVLTLLFCSKHIQYKVCTLCRRHHHHHLQITIVVEIT